MRRLAFILVLLTLASLPLMADFEANLIPQVVKCAPTTPESIQAEMRREELQRKYDAAEEIVSSRLHRVGCDDEWAEAIARAAVDNHVAPVLLAGLVRYESTCNPKAVSGKKSIGLTQVNPKVWKQWTVEELRNPYINAQAGARILSGFIKKYGLKEGLHHYNGMGDPSDTYSTMVLHYAGMRS